MPSSLFIVPSYHPAFALRNNRRYLGVIGADFKRAVALSKGWRPKWNDDNYIVRPTLEDVRAFCAAAKGKKVAFDIETDGRHPLICDVRCLGMFDGTRGICIPFLYRDGSTRLVPTKSGKKLRKVANWARFYDDGVEAQIIELVNGLLGDSSTTCITQNGQFDRLCLRSRKGIRALPGFDTILAHHTVASCFPHGLAFISSIYTDTIYYKSTEEGEAWSSSSDLELWIYCIRDCKATWISAERLYFEVHHTQPQNVRIYEHDQRMELECEKWKEHGIRVDVKMRDLLREHYGGKSQRALGLLRKTVKNSLSIDDLEELLQAMSERDQEEADGPCIRCVGTGALDDGQCSVCEGTGEVTAADTFNPGSLKQLRKVLSKLGVPLMAKTAGDELSTAKEYLFEARMDMLESGVKSSDPRIASIDYLNEWRENAKLKGTFLNPEILPDGKMHATFNVHVVPTGRLSSSDPNFTNQPKEIRCMYVADDEDDLLVSEDWDSGELRLSGLLSDEPILNKAFEDFDAGRGPKIHVVNTIAIFGLSREALLDEKSNVLSSAEPLYRASKSFIYSISYGAGLLTAYKACQKEMRDLTIGAFKIIYERVKKTYSRLFTWQQELVRETLARGYMESPVLKRVRYFFERVEEGSQEAAAMLNNPNQSALADIVSLANFRVLDRVCAKGVYKSPKQLGQVHDELLFSVKADVAKKFAMEMKKVSEEMPPEAPKHWKGRLPVGPSIKKRWADPPVAVLMERARKLQNKTMDSILQVYQETCKELDVDPTINEKVKKEAARLLKAA